MQASRGTFSLSLFCNTVPAALQKHKHVSLNWLPFTCEPAASYQGSLAQFVTLLLKFRRKRSDVSRVASHLYTKGEHNGSRAHLRIRREGEGLSLSRRALAR